MPIENHPAGGPFAAPPTIAGDGRPVAPPAPVAPAPVVEPVRTVYEPVVEPVVERRVVTSGRRYAPDSFIVGAIGVALIIIGLIAAIRAGFDGPMDDPVVKVLGFTHTATLGLIEAGIGLCLLIAALATSRAMAIFFGLVLGVGAVVGLVQNDSFDRSLALQTSLAWLLLAAAIVVVLVSLLMPRASRRSSRVEAA